MNELEKEARRKYRALPASTRLAMGDERAVELNPPPQCDHICLLEEGHVENGEPHFYGYEHPSPRRGIVPTVEVTPPYTEREHRLAALISTVPPLSQMHPVMALPLARFLLGDDDAGELLGVDML